MAENYQRVFAENGGKTVIPDVDYDNGWDFVGDNPPEVEDFNSVMNEQDLKISEIHREGIVTYDADTDYTAATNDHTKGDDGIIYRCAIDNGPNSAPVDPVGDLSGTWQVVIDNPVITRETEGSYTWTQYKYPSGRLKLVFAGNIPVTTATTTNVTLQYPTSFIPVATEPHSVNITTNNIIGNRNGYAFTVNGGIAASKDEVAIRYVATATGTSGDCWTSIVAEGRWK